MSSSRDHLSFTEVTEKVNGDVMTYQVMMVVVSLAARGTGREDVFNMGWLKLGHL